VNLMTLNNPTLEVKIKHETLLREARNYRLVRAAQSKSRRSPWQRLALAVLTIRSS
jgi:hypothetical protein